MSAGNRRDFLRILAAGAGVSALAGAAGFPAHAQPKSPLTVTPLGESLALISGAGGNVVVAMGPDGLVLVNSGGREHTGALQKAIDAHAGGQRVRTVINTDWHPDLTGGNEAFAKAGAEILAHEYTKQYLSTELVDCLNQTHKPRPAQALPSRTFYTAGSLTLGAERIEYAPLGQAHTDGDIYVFFRTANVLVAGDMLTVGRYPIADYTTGGWLGGMIAAAKTMIDLTNAETRIVPGTGPVQTRADLQAEHDMLSAMRERFVKMMKQGMGPEDMLAGGVTKDFDAKWGSPDVFVPTSYRGLWLHVRELGGIV